MGSAAGQHEEDGELVRRACAGDAGARAQFAARMRCVARILCARNARAGGPLGPEELEDLGQDTLAAIWHKLPTYDGSARLETWVYRFCELEFLRKLRSKGRGRLVLEPSLEGTQNEPLAPAERSELDDQELLQGLDALEEEVGSVLRLKHYEDLTFEAIGTRLGVSVNTAKTRYYRGLQKLRSTLVKTTSGSSAARRT